MSKWLACAGVLFLLLTAIPRLAAATDSSGEKDHTPIASVEDPASTDGEMDPNASGSETLLLEVVINGRSTGKIGEFVLRHGNLYSRLQELRDLGFRVPSTHAFKPNQLIALSTLPGIEFTIDVKNQQLQVTAIDAALQPQSLPLNGGGGLEGHRTIESGTGVTLNYDTEGTFSSGQESGTGSFDLRAFAPWGIISSDWLANASAASISPGANKTVRLDSGYTFADANTLRRYSMGDFINGGLTWNRPVHMEGVQIRSDFSMRPDLVTFPLPSIAGSASVPSTVDVLVNGNLVSSSQVDPGPFQVPQLPVISGSGTITMTMTNAQGGQVTVTQPFYGGSSLLAPGLQTFAGQAGVVRRNWGALSNDYGKPAATAFYRRGLTPQFTVEATGEGTPGACMGAAGATALIGNLGIVNLDLAASGCSGNFGQLLSAGVQHIGTKFNLGGSAILANHNYRDVASMNGAGTPRKQMSAFTGISLRRFGSAGVAYAGLDEDPSPTAVQVLAAQPLHSHVVSANYSFQFHHVAFYATEFRDLDNSGSSGLQTGITIPLRRRTSISVSGSSTGSVQVQAQQSAVMIGDWGYDSYVSTGNSNHEFGQVQYKSPAGLFTAGVDQSSGVSTLRLESQGALSLVDRGLFPSNWVYDSFAIVDTGPLEHVHVYQENRDVGVTGKSGRLLVPDMRSFDVNHLGIESTDVPADATLSTDKRVVRPQDRSGVVVRFPIRFSHAAMLKLVDQAGNPLPVGSAATLRATGAVAPVGYDGDAYIENLNLHNELTVELVDGHRCNVFFDYKAIVGDIPTIGPLRCVEPQK